VPVFTFVNPTLTTAERSADASVQGYSAQKVTKQLISSKKSRFITGAYFNYATSPPMNRDGSVHLVKKQLIFTDEKNDRYR
jgi:hypothetical protein